MDVAVQTFAKIMGTNLWVPAYDSAGMVCSGRLGVATQTPETKQRGRIRRMVMDNGRVTALKERDPGGEVSYPRAPDPR